MTVEMTIPAMHVRKGEMMLRLGLGMPGQARAHRVPAITATDSRGAIALEAPSGMLADWHAPRAVEGDVPVRYTPALESIPMLQAGLPPAVPVDVLAFIGIWWYPSHQHHHEKPAAIPTLTTAANGK